MVVSVLNQDTYGLLRWEKMREAKALQTVKEFTRFSEDQEQTPEVSVGVLGGVETTEYCWYRGVA